MSGKVSVLIPAYNEADRIYDTVQAVKGIPGVGEVIVVDDGSRDKTSAQAIKAGGFVVQLDKNRGKGGAVNAGLRYARNEIILLLDGDLGPSAREAGVLLQPILHDEADLVIAAFPSTTKSGFGLAQGFARFAIYLVGHMRVQSPLSGQRAIRRKALVEMGGVAPGFGMEVTMTLQALKLGYRVRETEVPFTHRKTGKNLRGFVHRAKQLWHMVFALGRFYLGRDGRDFVDEPQPQAESGDGALKEGQPTCN